MRRRRISISSRSARARRARRPRSRPPSSAGALRSSRAEQLGGCSVFSGTIPSKTLREAVLYLTGFSQRSIYGQSYRVKDDITMEDLRMRAAAVSQRERRRRSAISSARNRVTVFDGVGELRRQRHRRDHGGGRPPPGGRRGPHRDRDRQPAGAAAEHRVRRGVDPRLRRHPQPQADPADARRRRGRRDRHRVRVDVRRRRHEGHRRRHAARAAAVLRLRDRARAAALAARPRRDLPPRRDGRRPSSATRAAR